MIRAARAELRPARLMGLGPSPKGRGYAVQVAADGLSANTIITLEAKPNVAKSRKGPPQARLANDDLKHDAQHAARKRVENHPGHRPH